MSKAFEEIWQVVDSAENFPAKKVFADESGSLAKASLLSESLRS
jgi:hypothetical protein